MSDVFFDSLRELLKKKYLAEDGNLRNYEKEIDIVENILFAINSKLSGIYEFAEPIGLGGAGIVFKLKDTHLIIDRALKIPRPTQERLIESVRSEAEFLSRIQHENIIKLYNLGDVTIEGREEKYPYYIMDYIHKAEDIRSKVGKKLEKAGGRKDLSDLTRWVAEKFYSISSAISFLHDNNIIHFDIKPQNILIDQNDKPVLSDLGFAKRKTSEEDETVVGFTIFYAHPKLEHHYRHMSNMNRVRKHLKPSEFNFIFDVYAFGKSLLEILSLIDQKFHDIVVYDYNFVYLHLAACRMLDGENVSARVTDQLRASQAEKGRLFSYYEVWIEINEAGFKQIKYNHITSVYNDLNKLLYGRHFLESVEELNAFYPKRVQCSEGVGAPFSKRVKYLIEHPVFKRLTAVPQLSLTRETYPTASHSRFEHSLGAFRNCCLYIQSLYNDHSNPLFRQLIDEKDIKYALLASLIHDLGQFPLAHEVEEVLPNFYHENLTIKLLDSTTKNRWGCTIKDIIEDNKFGWGVSVDKLKTVLSKGIVQSNIFEKENIKTKLIKSLIDGPIDVDKLDYLIRDSKKCHLRYGELIDFERLIRNLTLITDCSADGIESLTVGVYEKGQSAAESLSFARYLMYQTVYWHRTSRSVRAMIKKAMSYWTESIKRSFIEDIESRMGIGTKPKNLTLEDTIDILHHWSDKNGKAIISMIKDRNLYKRIVTFHDDERISPESTLSKFRKLHADSDFQKAVRIRICDAFKAVIKSQAPTVSYFSEEKFAEVPEKVLNDKNFLFDCPSPIYGTKQKLRIIPEPQRLQKNYFDRIITGRRVSEVWNEIYFKLMNIAAKGRIFCHPEIRDPVMTVLGLNHIKKIVREVIDEF